MKLFGLVGVLLGLSSPPKPPSTRALDGLQLVERHVIVNSPSMTKPLNFTIIEVAKPREMIENWMEEDAVGWRDQRGKAGLDPFGVVLWPGARVAAARILSPPLGPTVLSGKRVVSALIASSPQRRHHG